MSQPNDPWAAPNHANPNQNPWNGGQNAGYGHTDNLYGTASPHVVTSAPRDPDFWRISPEYPLNLHERKPSIFSIAGRMGRMSYILQTLLHIVLGAALIPLAIFEVATWMFPFATVVIGIAILWANVTIQIKRAHDCGLSGLWLLTWLVPILTPVVPWLVVFWPGQPYANRYGNPPR